VLCAVRYKSLRRADHFYRGVLPNVACPGVISVTQTMRRPWPTRAVESWKKNVLFITPLWIRDRAQSNWGTAISSYVWVCNLRTKIILYVCGLRAHTSILNPMPTPRSCYLYVLKIMLFRVTFTLLYRQRGSWAKSSLPDNVQYYLILSQCCNLSTDECYWRVLLL